VQMHYSQMLCDSVIAPGGDNRPAAAREFDDADDLLIDDTTPVDDEFWGR